MTMETLTPGPGLSDRWRAWRNGLIGDPRFQRWAASFPLTRVVARRRAQALFDLSAGFVYSQIAYACVRSGLLQRLAHGPAEPEVIGRQIDLSPHAAERLLKAAAALKLSERCRDGRYALGVEGAALMGAPGVAAMIEHHALLYADLADPLALLRRDGGRGQLSGYWPYAEGHGAKPGPEAARAYSTLMSVSQAMVAAQVLDAYPIARHRRLLDLGGGDGTFLSAVARRAPRLQLALFDLPAVAATAEARFAADGIPVTVTGGSFFEDSLPRGADILSLVRILHDHDDGPVMALLKAARDALPPGGTLLIAEPMAQTPDAERMGDAYFGMYLLAMGSGRPRTADELRGMLQAAGFKKSRLVSTAMPMVARVLIATS